MRDKLNRYAKNVTSQHGEDGIIEFLERTIGDRMIRTCCEFGAFDGIAMSNAFNLWANRGWKAVLVESDSHLFEALKKNTAAYDNVEIFHQRVEPRGEMSLDALFRSSGLPTEIGLLSIDIDSTDYHVWKNIESVSAQIVIIEFNQGIPAYIDYHDPEGDVFLRCSAKSLERLGIEKGYKLVCCTVTNAIFVRDDLFDSNSMPDCPVEYLFDWSELAPALIKINNDGNKYPVWTSRQRSLPKMLNKFYYRVSSLIHKKQSWHSPSEAVISQIRNAGLDL